MVTVPGRVPVELGGTKEGFCALDKLSGSGSLMLGSFACGCYPFVRPVPVDFSPALISMHPF